LIIELLQSEGYTMSHCMDGLSAVQRILEEDPDLVVLDVMLPNLDGIAVCRRVRSHYRGTIIMLTALGEDSNQLAGLGVGADDYLVKTSASRLLCARIQAHLRRQDRQHQLPVDPSPIVDLGWLMVDRTSREAYLTQSRLQLTTSEFDLLLYLASHAGRVVSRADVARDLDGLTVRDVDDRSIDLRISRLRRKLGPPEIATLRLKSVRGEGYLLARRDPAVNP
jgi:DNA-binding response OmpR family regulator